MRSGSPVATRAGLSRHSWSTSAATRAEEAPGPARARATAQSVSPWRTTCTLPGRTDTGWATAVGAARRTVVRTGAATVCCAVGALGSPLDAVTARVAVGAGAGSWEAAREPPVRAR